MALMFYFGSFSNFKTTISDKINISFEQEEKNDNESQDLKLALVDENNLKLTKLLKPLIFRDILELSEFKPETPTSPPNC